MSFLKGTASAAAPKVAEEGCAHEIEYDFAEKPSKEFYCPVTFDLLLDPHQTDCCGNHLSQEAVAEIKRNRGPCPLCKKPALETHPDKFFKRKVNELGVYCPNKDKGCEWVGELGNLDQHLSNSFLGGDCQFVTVECPHLCGVSFQRCQFGELEKHKADGCPNRPFSCEFCGHRATYSEVTGEHWRVCEKYPVECPNRDQGCPWSGTQGDVDGHTNYGSLEGECGFVSVACPYGCDDELPRRDVDSHKADDCPNRPFTCRYCGHKATYNEVINEHWEMQCEKYPLPCPGKCGAEGIQRKDLDKHFQVCPVQVIDCEFSRFGCEVGCQRQHMKHHMDEVVKFHLSLVSKVVEEQQQVTRDHQITFAAVLREHQSAAKRQMTVMEARIGEQGARIDELNAEIRELNAKIEEQGSKMKQLDAEWRSRIEEQDAKLNEQGSVIAEQQCTIKQQQNEIEALILVLSQALPKPINPVFIPPPDFVMANFEAHRISENLWSSRPFYSHIGGYKMCLRVHANGSGTARGTHVSVLVQLMQGEHDEHLKWPFCGDITWQLINQKREVEHLQRTVNFNDTVGPRGVADSPSRQEIARLVRGFSKFISHAELVAGSQDKAYLKNDCLKFRVLKVIVKSSHSEDERSGPLKESDGEEAQLMPTAPLDTSDSDDGQIVEHAPLKASDSDDGQIVEHAPLKAGDWADAQIEQTVLLKTSYSDDAHIVEYAAVKASDVDTV